MLLTLPLVDAVDFKLGQVIPMTIHLLESLGNKEHALRGEREDVKSVIILVAA